jgi:hypothetical protein
MIFSDECMYGCYVVDRYAEMWIKLALCFMRTNECLIF